MHIGGPASITPASTTGNASHFAAAHRSWLLQRTHASPLTPHSKRVVPSTHSVADAQQPSHVERSQSRWQPQRKMTTSKRLHRMSGAL